MHAERALVCLEQHFGSQLVEYERNMAEQMRQEVGANRAEVTSALEAVTANKAQLVARGNVAFEQRDRALRQTVREKISTADRAHSAPIAKHVFRRSWCELDTAKSSPPGCGG